MTESLTKTSTVTLNNGINMPRFGLGTWRSPAGEVSTAVKHALKEGYIHLDCAWCYFNQVEVGEAIAASIEEKHITRENLFVTTKLWNTFHRPELLRKNMETCLKDLGLDYVDNVQLHYSLAMVPQEDETVMQPRLENGDAHLDDTVDLKQTWKVMEGFVMDGLAKSIGVANFTKGIHVTAYAPLGNVNPDFACALKDPVICQIAERVSKTPAQVIIRWNLQRGVTVIPKSVNPGRIAENKDVFDFHLSDEDVAAIDKLGERKLRMCNWKMRPGGKFLYEGETSAYPDFL
ncbi:unnamed protein product [Ascophyllum nodosum]